MGVPSGRTSRRRRSPGALGVVVGSVLLSGCTLDHRLAALQQDPLATVSVEGAREVRRSEQTSDVDGGLLGKPREARITRHLQLDDPAHGSQVLASATARAEEAGWVDVALVDRPHAFQGERTIDGVRCRLLLYLTEEHGVDGRIFPHRTLMVYLAASNSE